MISPVLSTCPSCQKRLRVKHELIGKQVRCPSCRDTFVVQTTSPAAKPSPSKAKLPADKVPPHQPAPLSSWPANPAAFPVQQPTTAAWQSVAQQKPTGASKKPLSKRVLTGAASLVAVLLVVGGYFGWQFFSQDQNETKVATNAAMISDADQKPNQVSENELSNEILRNSLLEYLPDNLKECQIKGTAIRTESGALALNDPDPESFVEIPVVLPEEYQMELSVRRDTPGGTFVVCVPHRGFPVSFVIDGKSGSGLSDIDGKSYAYNVSNVRGRQFKNDQTHSIQIVSSPDGLFLDFDGKRLIEFEGAPKQLSLESYSVHPNRMFPGLKAANRGHFLVEQAMVETSGLSTPKKAIPAYPQSEASNKLAQERFGPGFREVLALAEKLGGFIMFESAYVDGFGSAYVGGQRLRFNVQSRKVTYSWNVPMKMVSVAGVDFSPLSEVTGPVKISAPATTNWPQATLPSSNPNFRLEILDLHNARDLTASVLQSFPLEQVSWLSLSHTKLDEDAADSIAAMKSLKLAQLRGVQIGEKNAAALASLPKLEVLHISSNLASDAAIERLSQSQSIQVLDIANESKDKSVLSDAALKSIEKMPGLRQLKLIKTGISQIAVERYRRANPDVDVKYTRAGS